MNPNYGSQSMVAPLRRVLVRRPDEAFAVDEPHAWHYTARPNLHAAQAEHDALVALLRQAGAEVIFHDAPQPGRADAIFVHDPALVTDAGAIVLRMGKPLREGEETAMAARFESLGIPVLARLSGEARAEGGDLLWLDEQTLAVGLGFRTNQAGLQQLQAALAPLSVTCISVELPYFFGPDACLHLMSIISLVDHDLAVVYQPLLPVPFWQELTRRGIRMVECPESEFLHSMGTNVLALAPGVCLMLEGNPVTQARLAAVGCDVQTYRGNEISLKAEGGATCLTRPILRRQ
ncbi:MAG: arginine deiminase family protein [Chloroflexaceae bacterium]|jgi:N-dimethylarginine dimethylaminohydrolase|nr:arginine deiminase family protein [Chloroflexaceae bacterium]